MSRATVRAAIQDYLSNAGINYLSQVYAHPPKVTPGGEFYASQDPGHSSGAVIYLHIANQFESREGIGGPTDGQKFRYYTCAMVCVFRSKKTDTQEVGADNDAFLDALVTAIEADRNAGNPAVIWQWGEGSFLYGDDIKVRAEMPRPIRQQISQVFSVCEVTTIESLST